jgi:hypothetical protein
MATPTRPPPLSLSNLTYVNNTPGVFSPLPNANNGITSPTSPNIVENNSPTNVNAPLRRTAFMNKLNAAAENSEDTDPIAPEENQAGGSRKRRARKSKSKKAKKSKKSKSKKSKKNVRRN